MNIWNKVFLGVIFVAAIAVLALAAVEFHIRGTGQQHTTSLEQRIEETDARIVRTRDGSATEPSFDELRMRLLGQYHEQGRAWFGSILVDLTEEVLPPALPQVIAPIIITNPLVSSETGAATEVVLPEQLRGVVYAFEEGEEGNVVAFLGRFNVDTEPTPHPFLGSGGNQITGYRVTLVSADPIGAREVEQIFEAGHRGSRWAIFLTPPVDRIAGIFDQLTEEERGMIPEEFWERFQPRPMPELTEEEREGVDSAVLAAWERLRETIDNHEAEAAADFASMLDWLYQRRSSLLRDIEVAESNIETFRATEEQVQEENERLEADGDLEETRVEAMNIQRDTVRTLLEQYQEEVNRIMLLTEKLQTLNAAYLARIAEYQATAVEIMEGGAESLVEAADLEEEGE